MSKRKMPVKTVTLDFTEDGYPGFTAEARINLPMGLHRRYFEMTTESDEAEVRALLLKLFPSWDFVDDDGGAIPHTAEGFDLIPPDLLGAMQRRRAPALREALMPAPLENSSSSAESPASMGSPEAKAGGKGRGTPSGR